jgi:hypothetical protein
MARHVSEGGTPFDDFGKHVVGLSEELNNLKKFKTYVGRSKVMAEGLSQYMDIIEGRAKDVKKELESIQKSNGYANIIENYETVVLEEVPDDVKTNWIDELTIRQFNEDLKDVFPYIYRLIGEGRKPQELGPDDLEELAPLAGVAARAVAGAAGSAIGNKLTSNKKNKKKIKKKQEDISEEMELGDTVHITSKNVTGMYYGEKDGEIIVRTPDGVETADPEDIEQIDSESQENADEQLPITEFILSHYDRETGSWPRGETAVLTGIEKDYGESFIEPAKQFIERVNQTFEQYNSVEEGCGCDDDSEEPDTDEDFERLKDLAGL